MTLQYLYYKSPYYLRMDTLWTDWPQRELSGLMKCYILCQWAFWIQQVIVINIEQRRKDHWQMLSHHIVTIILVAASYAYHQSRIGHLILILMDVVDLVFPVGSNTSIDFVQRQYVDFDCSWPSVSNTLDTRPSAISSLASFSSSGWFLDTSYTWWLAGVCTLIHAVSYARAVIKGI